MRDRESFLAFRASFNPTMICIFLRAKTSNDQQWLIPSAYASSAFTLWYCSRKLWHKFINRLAECCVTISFSTRNDWRFFRQSFFHWILLPGSCQTVSSIFPRHSAQDVVSSRARNIIAALNSGPIRAPPSSTSIKLHRLAVMLTSHPRRTECCWC